MLRRLKSANFCIASAELSLIYGSRMLFCSGAQGQGDLCRILGSSSALDLGLFRLVKSRTISFGYV